MNRRKLIVMLTTVVILSLVVVALIAVQAATAQDVEPADAQAPTAQDVEAASINLPARWSYAAKFVCGSSDVIGAPPAEPDVKPGNYATKINIHNPNAQSVRVYKKVALALPEGTTPITPTKRVRTTLGPDYAVSINCKRIVELLHKDYPTLSLPPFIEGFLVIDAVPITSATALSELDVVAVYTAAPLSTAGAAMGMVSSIQVKEVPGRKVPAMTVP